MVEAYFAAASEFEFTDDDFGQIQEWCTDTDTAMDVCDSTLPVTPPAVIADRLAYLSSMLLCTVGGVDLAVLGSTDQVVPEAATFHRAAGFELPMPDLAFFT